MNNEQPPGLHNDPPYILASSYVRHEKSQDNDLTSALATVRDTAMNYADKYKTAEGEER